MFRDTTPVCDLCDNPIAVRNAVKRAGRFKGNKFDVCIECWDSEGFDGSTKAELEEIEKDREDGSDLDIVKSRWASLGYELQTCFCSSVAYGLPQGRYRCYIVAVNTRDPKTFTFQNRSINCVFQTFRE